MTNINLNRGSGIAGNHPEKPGKEGKSGSGVTWIIVVVLFIILITLFFTIIKPAIDASSGQAQQEAFSGTALPIAKVFLVLFLMLGPFKVIGPFAKMTQGADAVLTRRTAFQGILFSCFALLLAAFMGGKILSNLGIPLPIMAISGGLILLLTALIGIIQQFKTHAGFDEEMQAPTLKTAISPLAFPTIVTPYGIAAIIVFLALSTDPHSRLIIGVIILVIMLSNLIFMLVTRYVFQIVGILLQVLAAVLGIVQVALGLQIINNSLKEILK
jgi:multiple antibiotic resistance protein